MNIQDEKFKRFVEFYFKDISDTQWYTREELLRELNLLWESSGREDVSSGNRIEVLDERILWVMVHLEGWLEHHKKAPESEIDNLCGSHWRESLIQLGYKLEGLSQETQYIPFPRKKT